MVYVVQFRTEEKKVSWNTCLHWPQEPDVQDSEHRKSHALETPNWRVQKNIVADVLSRLDIDPDDSPDKPNDLYLADLLRIKV